MGEVINVTTVERALPEALTGTEQSGFRTGNYLADRPAIDVVGADEQVQFVVTNQMQGIAMRDGTTTHTIPDPGYQTVVVVTDRRVIALVGMADGDEQFTLDIADITDATVTAGRRANRLTIEQTDGPTWEIQTDDDGLAGVANYLRKQSGASGSSGTRGTAESIRVLVEATIDTAKTFRRDRMAQLLPASEKSPSGGSGPGRPSGPARKAETDGPSVERADSGTETPRTPEMTDTETAIDATAEALAKTDWSARSAQPASPFDLLAEREDELVGIVVDCPDHGTLDRESIKQCSAITGAAGTDTVMLATTAPVRNRDAKLAAELGVRLRNIETFSDATDPPTIEVMTEMVSDVLANAGWSVRPKAMGPFDLLADHEDELMGVVVHSPEDGPVRNSIRRCNALTGAAGTDTVVLATTGTVRDADEQLADDLGLRLLKSDSLGEHHVTEIDGT